VTATLNGLSVSCMATVSIISSSPPPTFLGLPGAWGYILLAIIVVAIILVIFLVVELRHRTTKKSTVRGGYGQSGVPSYDSWAGETWQSNPEVVTGPPGTVALGGYAGPSTEAVPAASTSVSARPTAMSRSKGTKEGSAPSGPAQVAGQAPTHGQTASPVGGPVAQTPPSVSEDKVSQPEDAETGKPSSTEDEAADAKNTMDVPPIAFIPLAKRWGHSWFGRSGKTTETRQTSVAPPMSERTLPEGTQTGESSPPGEETTTKQAPEVGPGSAVTPKVSRCATCGSELDGDYCRQCDKHWDTKG
jgi:hypothetical protein